MSDSDPTAPAPTHAVGPSDAAAVEPDSRPTVQRVPPPGDPLRLVRVVAWIGVAALIFGRFIAPALPGTVVGAARLVRGVELAGAFLSQLFAISVQIALATALVHTAASTVPPWMRLLGVALASFAAFLVLGASTDIEAVPRTAALLAAGSAGAFAILAAAASRASRVVRLPAVVLGLVGAGALVRVLRGLVYLHGAGSLSPASLASLGRGLTTTASILVGLAALLALVYIGRASRAEPQEPGRDGASLWTPVTLVVLVLAVVCARQAAAGASADAGTLSVLLKRAADRFLIQPEAHLRGPFRLFLGFLTPLTAAGLLAVRRVPTLGAALCLALVAADVADAPLGAMTLVLSSLGILLVARSGHVLWSALVARPPAAPARDAERAAPPG